MYVDDRWLDPKYHDEKRKVIMKPDRLEVNLKEPPRHAVDKEISNRITGSMMGLVLGDALGAHVEFRPRQYLLEHPVRDLEGGGTWGLNKGQVNKFKKKVGFYSKFFSLLMTLPWLYV